MNRLVLAARMVRRGALRYTPAGLPALDLGLEHKSELSHEGQPRKVQVELRALVIGPLVHSLSALDLGTEGTFGGFLGSARNGRGILFHVTEVALSTASTTSG